jgi:hypothetical protein
MECPRCGHPQIESAVECIACGVILAKARPPLRDGAGDDRSSDVHADDNVQADDDGDGASGSWPARLGALLMADARTDAASCIGRTVLLVPLLLWTWMFAIASVASNAAGGSFLHLINLPFHEAGHILFAPFGRFLTVLGGSLTQVLVPAALTVVFLTRHRDPFGAAVTTWWCGENFVDLAPYIGDARALQLVLIGGRTGAEVEGHDWEYILTSLGWLSRDRALAGAAQAIGVAMMAAAFVWAVWLVRLHWQRSRVVQSEAM